MSLYLILAPSWTWAITSVLYTYVLVGQKSHSSSQPALRWIHKDQIAENLKIFSKRYSEKCLPTPAIDF